MTDYAGNSKKSKGDDPKPEKVVERVTKGEVVVRKKSLGHRLKETFFGGDARSVAEYIGVEVLLPAMRDLIVDTAVKGVSRMVYGDGPSAHRATPGAYGPRQTIFDYSSRSRSNPIDARAREVRPRGSAHIPDQPSRPRVRRSEVDFLLSSRGDADLVLEGISLIIEKYEVVSLADVHDLLGLPTNPVDFKWGWFTLDGITIQQVREGYLLILPNPEAL